jgi:hypothetical protein
LFVALKHWNFNLSFQLEHVLGLDFGEVELRELGKNDDRKPNIHAGWHQVKDAQHPQSASSPFWDPWVLRSQMVLGKLIKCN